MLRRTAWYLRGCCSTVGAVPCHRHLGACRRRMPRGVPPVRGRLTVAVWSKVSPMAPSDPESAPRRSPSARSEKRSVLVCDHGFHGFLVQVCSIECPIEGSIECPIEVSIECPIECCMECCMECCIECSIECSIECRIECRIECSIEGSISCPIDYSI